MASARVAGSIDAVAAVAGRVDRAHMIVDRVTDPAPASRHHVGTVENGCYTMIKVGYVEFAAGPPQA
jgi:hypothetical protein